MTRVTATVPGYASIARASDVLHLARRSVRDLIYAGRLPSLRVGRLHFIKATDLELERRRRLGLPLPEPAKPKQPRPRRIPLQPDLFSGAPRIASHRKRGDSAVRRQRAAERAELVRHWVQRHHTDEPRLPAVVLGVSVPVTCEVCGREVRRGRVVEMSIEDGATMARLCTTCGRRALLEWADRRRQEAVAARRLSESLGEQQAELIDTRVA